MNWRNAIVLLLLGAAFPLSEVCAHAGSPQPQGKLSKEQTEELARLQNSIDKPTFAGEFGEALRLAREVAALRAKWQGDKHWQTVNARLDVERWQRLADLPAGKQKDYAAAIRFGSQGMELSSLNQYALAEGSWRKALEVCREVLGEKHPEAVLSYTGVASNLNDQGKYAQAQPLFQKALDIQREVFGEKHPRTAESYNNVAVNIYDQGKYALAQPLLQKALDIRREVLGEKHPDTVESYNNVALNLNDQGKYALPQPLLQKALDICHEVLGEKHPHTALSYNSVAYTLNAQGKYALAQPLYQKALDIRREVLGEKHTLTAQSYNNVAYNLNNQGKYAQAQPLFQKALDIRREVHGEKHPNTADGYNNVAMNLDDQGKYALAQPLLQKALDIRREVLGEKHPDTALSYHNVAHTLVSQGKYSLAQPLLQKALDIRREVLGEKHPRTAESYNNVALNLNSQGKHALAQPLFQKALGIRLEVFGEKHPLTALSYHNVAYNLNNQGKYALAQPLYQKSLDISLAVHGEKHPFTAHSYNSVAMKLDDQGKYALAQPLLKKALDIRREVLGEKHPRTAQSYQDLAYNFHQLGEYEQAEKALHNALLTHDIARIDRVAPSRSSGFERALGSRISPRSRLAVLMARRGAFMEAWQQAEADLARGLLDDLADPSDKPDHDPKAQAALLRKLDERLVPLLSAARLDRDQEELREELLRERQKIFDDLATQLAKKSAELVLPLEKIQQQIAGNAALLLWLDADPDHFCCILRQQGPPRWVKLPGTGKNGAWNNEERNLPQRLYAALATPGNGTETERTQLIRAFVKLRFEPLKEHLQAVDELPAVRQLLVVPRDVMGRIPLEALVDGYTISYVPSGSIFARMAAQHRPLQASSLLALGDPVFALPSVKPVAPPTDGLFIEVVLPGSNAAKSGLQAGDVLLRYNDTPLKKVADLKMVLEGSPVKALRWRDGEEKLIRLEPGKLGIIIDKRSAPEAVLAWRETKNLLESVNRTGCQRLLGSRYETAALAKLVGKDKTTLLLDADASLETLDRLSKNKEGLKRFRILHFATHGYVNQYNPYYSSLILTHEKQITVEKIRSDWQLDADLVVLSACQTALGKDASGEGHLGFAQAFLNQGARSVLMSRWRVDDTATALLMLRFYENVLGKRAGLKTPMKRAEALQEARVWLRELSRAEVEKLAVGLTDGVPRGPERPETPLTEEKTAIPPGDRPFAHPYYWASFNLVGDPN